MGHSKELNRSCKVSKRFLSGSLPQCMRGYKTSALAYSYPNFHLQETRQKSRWMSWWWLGARGGRKCLKMFISIMRKSWPFYKLYQGINDVYLLPNRDDIIKDELHTTAMNFNTSLIVQLYGKPINVAATRSCKSAAKTSKNTLKCWWHNRTPNQSTQPAHKRRFQMFKILCKVLI